jgi:hypothetical protein
MLGTRTMLLDKLLALLYVLVRENLVCCAGRYDMALRLGDIMEELSQHDYYTHDGQDAVPAWVRAHYILDQQMIQQRAGEGSTPQSAVRAGAVGGNLEACVAVRHTVLLSSGRRCGDTPGSLPIAAIRCCLSSRRAVAHTPKSSRAASVLTDVMTVRAGQ